MVLYHKPNAGPGPLPPGQFSGRSPFRPKLLAPLLVVALLAVLVTSIDRVGAAASLRDRQWALDSLSIDDTWSLVPSTTNEPIVVAVLDTAIAAGHQDLAGSLVDGYDFIEGRPFAVDDPDRMLAESDHGTMVASIIAAPHDQIGIDGVAPGANIMPVRVVPDSGQGTAANMAAGIDWAIDNGADIINVSIRTTRDSPVVRTAVERAAELGVPIVASAGLGPSAVPFFPAGYESVIAVAALTPSLSRYSGSPEMDYVDVAAPGTEIMAAGGAAVDTYRTGKGTSFAAPHVAGLMALMMQGGPSVETFRLRTIIESTAIDLGDQGRDNQYGFGLIDPSAAVAAVIDAEVAKRPLLTGASFGNRVLLSWSDPDAVGALGYEIVRPDGVVIERVEPDARTVLLSTGRQPGDGVLGVRSVRANGQRGETIWESEIGDTLPTSVSAPSSWSVGSFFTCDRCFPGDMVAWRAV